MLFLLTDFIMESCHTCMHIKERTQERKKESKKEKITSKMKKNVNLTEIHETL